MAPKISIKSALCEQCTNFSQKALTNVKKHDIIIASKETIGTSNTGG